MVFERVREAADYLTREFGAAPEIAIVLGSGLSAFAKTLKEAKTISTTEIPHSAKSTVLGHDGQLVVGHCKNTRVAVLAGRVHGYEGHSPDQVVHNLRALRLWGVKRFVLTNAAGSTRKTYKPGQLILLKDHLNFTGQNPLMGIELFEGERFLDCSDLYSKAWRKRVLAMARKQKIQTKEGVYAGLMGPTFETAAEVRMFAKLGADLVGMSTVWEALAVKQMGADVLGLSCVTNFGTGVTAQPLHHSEVIETTRRVQKDFNRFMEGILYLENRQ